MKVIVLMGGDSTEREVSLVSGQAIAEALIENGHKVIRMDPGGLLQDQIRLNGDDGEFIGLDIPDFDKPSISAAARHLKNILLMKRLKPDVVFNGLHGGKGENGVIQSMLDAAGIPYTGSGSLSCMLAMQKDLSKMIFRQAKLPVPKAQVLDRPDASRKNLKNLVYPQVVKPNDQGSTVGLTIVPKADELDAAIDLAFRYSEKVLVEEYIPGREMTVGIIKSRTLPVIEITPKHGLYDYECKYTQGMSSYTVPAEISDKLSRELQSLSLKAHQLLGCKGYSRVDFRVNDNDEPFILEVNTLPGMTGTSLVPKAARAVGINFNSLIEMIIEEAINP